MISRKALSLAIGCCLMVLAAQLLAQTSTNPFAFEIASIKKGDPSRDESISRVSDRLAMVNVPVEKMILWAYHLSGDRLLAQPGWITSARYNVLAKAPAGELPAGRVNLMMQSLLAERFKLAAHWEARDGARYSLRVDRSGPKVRFTPAGDGPAPQNPFRMTRPGSLAGSAVTTAMLATVLSDQVGRFVADETKLDGVFDFTLDWTPDSATQPPDGPPGLSLFTAIREQLGLTLEANRGPVDVLVIDHIERPTED